MDKSLFVKNIKFYCDARGVKPTNACREAGVSASFISNIETRGQTPSVEKVEMLAHYLGVTVSELIGETAPQSGSLDTPLALRDSAVRLKSEEVDLIFAYRKATEKEKKTINDILSEYKKGTVSSAG